MKTQKILFSGDSTFTKTNYECMNIATVSGLTQTQTEMYTDSCGQQGHKIILSILGDKIFIKWNFVHSKHNYSLTRTQWILKAATNVHKQCVYFTYSDDIEGIVTHFSDLSIFVMH